MSVPETWAQFSSRNVQRSAAERATSRQLRSESDLLISTCASEMWDAWNRSNNNLAKRSSEVMEAKSKLEMHLHKATIIFELKFSGKQDFDVGPARDF